MTARMTRRSALKAAAGAALAAPFLYRKGLAAPPSETVRLMAVGAGGRGGADIQEFAGSKAFQLVAFADVDPTRAAESGTTKRWPNAKIYTDYRKMFDEMKDVDAVSVSTPDHTHAPAAMRAMLMGKPVCCQKPLTHSLYEARQLAKVAAEKKLVTQMGIQIHSAGVHKQVVKIIQDGTIGKVKDVHSWSYKDWGDASPLPTRTDTVPAGLAWDNWLGVAADRPYVGGGYYHPGNWRKRLDFGCGTFGDMGCHILDPVFGSLALTYPKSVKATAGGPTETNWGLNNVVEYVYPGTKYTTENLALTWYDGNQRPGPEVTKHGSRSTNSPARGRSISAPKASFTRPTTAAKTPFTRPTSSRTIRPRISETTTTTPSSSTRFAGSGRPRPRSPTPGHLRNWFSSVASPPGSRTRLLPGTRPT